MKKLKIIMPIAAFVFAIAFSFASVKMFNDPEQGEFIKLTNPTDCQPITANCNGDSELCTVSGKQVYEFRDGTICSEPLYRD